MHATLAALAASLLALAGGCGKSASVSAGDGEGRTQLLARTAAALSAAKPAPRATDRTSSNAGEGAQASATVPPAGTPATNRSPSGSSSSPARPAIVQSPIPFGQKRRSEMVSYARRHYGLDSYRLIDPHVIVIHYSQTPDFQSTWNTFAPDVPDSELHELPNTCAHFVVDADGTIHQLVPLGVMCRHTVGLNWTAIGVEHVGYSDGEVLSRARQMRASLRLVRWLRCRYGIPVGDVIGHNESLSSPYHHENVAALRDQTHSDFNRADMRIYRARLRAAGPCQ